MLVINKYKPFYIDEIKKTIRMGNFPETGKEINYEDDSLARLFEYAKEPIEEDELIRAVLENHSIVKDDVKAAIDYLKQEKFLIETEEYEQILSDEKYSRQNLYFNMFSGNSKNIPSNKKILILGLGGIGANVANILARSGFKNFILVDCDEVELSNLTKQFPYTVDDIGKQKTEVLKSLLIKDNINIETVDININNESDIADYIKKADFVVSTIDKPFRIIRRLINKVCVKYDKPVIFAGFAEHVGMIGPFIIPHKTSCLMCTEKETSELPLRNVDIVPSYGPLCLIISSIISNEIINYYINYNDYNLEGKTLMFNMATYETETISWEKKKDCEVCNSYDSK